jgi:hypothetical protein
MRSPAEDDILPAKADEFRDPEACLNRHQKKGPVPPACPGTEIRHRQQGIDLWTGEEGYLRPVVSFAGYRENPLNEGATVRLVQGSVLEKGMNRGQPAIAAARAIAPILLEVVQEGAHKRGVEIRQRQYRWCFL